MGEQDSENTDNLSRRDVLQTVVGTGIAGAAGLVSTTNTAAAAPAYYVRYWPIDTDVESCTSASGKVSPGTGQGAAHWFHWNDCSSYKTYAAIPGLDLYLKAHTNGAVLTDISFDIKEPDGSGGWETVRSIDGPTGKHLDKTYTHTPDSNRVRIDADQPGFYLRVYGPPQVIPPGTKEQISEKDTLINQIQTVANTHLPPGTQDVDQRGRELLTRIEDEYKMVDKDSKEQFNEALDRMIPSEKITETAVTAPISQESERWEMNLVELHSEAKIDVLAALSVFGVAARASKSPKSIKEEYVTGISDTVIAILDQLSSYILDEDELDDQGRQKIKATEKEIAENTSSWVDNNRRELASLRIDIEENDVEDTEVPQELKNEFLSKVLDSSTDGVKEIIYHWYMFDLGKGLTAPGIDTSINASMEELDQKVKSSELVDVSESELDFIEEDKSQEIMAWTNSSIETFDSVSLIRDVFSFTEVVIMLISYKFGGSGAFMIPVLSTAFGLIAGGQGLVGEAVIDEIQKEHRDGVEEIVTKT